MVGQIPELVAFGACGSVESATLTTDRDAGRVVLAAVEERTAAASGVSSRRPPHPRPYRAERDGVVTRALGRACLRGYPAQHPRRSQAHKTCSIVGAERPLAAKAVLYRVASTSSARTRQLPSESSGFCRPDHRTMNARACAAATPAFPAFAPVPIVAIPAMPSVPIARRVPTPPARRPKTLFAASQLFDLGS